VWSGQPVSNQSPVNKGFYGLPSQLDSDKTQSEQQSLSCPVGEPECSFISELARVRLEVANLQAMVRTDELTGLFNYRHFQESLGLEMERARRSGQTMSLIMLDLDHFKLVNDSWGHEFGNIVLARVSKLLLETVRRVDIACRFGG
jgi:PleD family two-component response regulator